MEIYRFAAYVIEVKDGRTIDARDLDMVGLVAESEDETHQKATIQIAITESIPLSRLKLTPFNKEVPSAKD